MLSKDEIYMSRCIEIAKAGIGHTAPNPMVGAVIVCDNKIIGEGYHRLCGKEHAEVNAIASVDDETLLKSSTLYVSLEPCSHYGKTPPCADLIIRKRIPRVVIGCMDPFPEVAGRGVKKLRDAGIEVVTGVMEKEAMALNTEFMTVNRKGRPYIYLKWAESADGLMDGIRSSKNQKPIVLSSSETLRYVHKLRSEVASIMVGTDTALLDNPSLTVRHWVGKQPVRIVLDRTLKLPNSLHLFDGSVQTLIFTAKNKTSRTNVEYITLDKWENIPQQVVNELIQRKINSLMIEGGSKLLQSFIDSGLWDEIRVEKTSLILKKGISAPVFKGILCTTEKRENNHLLQMYRNRYSS